VRTTENPGEEFSSIRYAIGYLEAVSLPVLVPETDRERVEPEIKKFRKEVFHRDSIPRIVSFAKARELLMRVKKSGRRIVLATSSRDLQEDRGDGGLGRGRGNE
jgi:hypothetical protein